MLTKKQQKRVAWKSYLVREIDVVEIEKGKDFIFTATVAVKPEVTLGDYKGIEVEKKTVKVMAADVNAEIDKVREQQQPYDYC